MAEHFQMRLVDDLDGSKAAETITFQVDSKEYEIDLNEEHAARLRDALAPYVAAGRRAGVSPYTTTSERSTEALASGPGRGTGVAGRAWLPGEGAWAHPRRMGG